MTAELRAKIYGWADANLEVKRNRGPYRTWEQMWVGVDRLYKLRICGNSRCGVLVVLTCMFGYGADEDAWHGICLGQVDGLEEVEAIYGWLNRKGERMEA